MVKSLSPTNPWDRSESHCHPISSTQFLWVPQAHSALRASVQPLNFCRHLCFKGPLDPCKFTHPFGRIFPTLFPTHLSDALIPGTFAGIRTHDGSVFGCEFDALACCYGSLALSAIWSSIEKKNFMVLVAPFSEGSKKSKSVGAVLHTVLWRGWNIKMIEILTLYILYS